MGYIFDCGICGYRRDLEVRVQFYDAPEQIRVMSRTCWCWECDDVRFAEHIPSLVAIVAECNAWKRRDQKYPYRIFSRPYPWLECQKSEVVALYDAIFTWRKQRQSPGRCLTCGSRRIGLTRTQFGKFEHPHCGGMLSGTHIFFPARYTEYPPAEIFSTEGLKIGERSFWP